MVGLVGWGVEEERGGIGIVERKLVMALGESGGNIICVWNICIYAEIWEEEIFVKKDTQPPPPQANFAKFHTPDVKTIESLAEFFKIDSFWTIKAVVKKAIFEGGKSEFAFFFLRGCDFLNETKALNAISGANEIVDVNEDEIKNIGLFPGIIGPYTMRNITQRLYIYFDT